MTTREKAENYALGFFLSNYNQDASFNEIIEVLESKDDDAIEDLEIDVWEPFEYDENDKTARSIVCMADDLTETFK